MTRRSPKKPPSPMAPPCWITALTSVDASKQRVKEIRTYERRTGDLELLTSQIKHHQDVDKPAHSLWIEQEFAAEITSCRTTYLHVSELEQLIDMVEDYSDYKHISASKAYAAIKSQLDLGKSLEQLDTELFKEPEKARDANEVEDADFEKEFSDLFEEVFGDTFGFNNDRRDDERSGDRFHHFHDDFSQRRNVGRDQESTDSVLRTTYRQLVRMLHPDMNSELTELQKIQWHEVQEAYRFGDVVKLQRILSAIKNNEDAFDFSVLTLSELIGLRKNAEKRVRTLKRQLKISAEDAWWQFTVVKNDRKKLSRLRQGVAQRLEFDFRMLCDARADLEAQIAVWQRAIKAPKPSSKQKQTKSKLGNRNQQNHKFGMQSGR